MCVEWQPFDCVVSSGENVYNSLSDLLDSFPPCPPGCCAIYLHVLRTNSHARRFYEHRGFYSSHVLHGCYSIAGRPADGCTYVMHMNGGYANRPLMYPFLSFHLALNMSRLIVM
ncbi:unnamed protein product [Echinostoma caproni]|uniref:histone acetyltransferase n=1 Tax=Echinostoma caproni TaxID=27848 RepID=A0A3P8GXX8_9TREM|nr:unnamed protein product [Echinostoma caproni]